MDILVEFIENTIVSLTCGCVSLVTIVAVCSFAVFFVFDVIPRAFPTKEPSKYASYFRVVKKVHDEADDEEIEKEEENFTATDKCQYAENDAVTPVVTIDEDELIDKNCDFGEGGSLEESSSSEVDQESQPYNSAIRAASTIDDRQSNDPTATLAVNDSAKDDQRDANLQDLTSESESEPLSCPPKPGTIAEREHSKWEHAAPIPNNPYSEESIRKRNIENTFFPSVPKICPSSNDDNESFNSKPRENGDNDDDFLDGDSPLSKYRKDYYVNEDLSVSIVNNDNITVYDTTCRDEKMVVADSVDSSDESTISKSQSVTPTSNLVRVSSWSERRGARSRWSENDANSVIGRQNGTRSVKELAKQFSQYATTIKMEDTCPQDRYPYDNNFPNSVHSLTARSTSKRFRDELKTRTTPTFNRNVHVFVSSPPASLTPTATSE